jgi:hypothetical protein
LPSEYCSSQQLKQQRFPHSDELVAVSDNRASHLA